MPASRNPAVPLPARVLTYAKSVTDVVVAARVRNKRVASEEVMRLGWVKWGVILSGGTPGRPAGPLTVSVRAQSQLTGTK